jgi:adenosine deaminase CECR1
VGYTRYLRVDEFLNEDRTRNMYGSDGEENIPHREWLVMFDRIINETKAELEAQGRPDDFIGARV